VRRGSADHQREKFNEQECWPPTGTDIKKTLRKEGANATKRPSSGRIGDGNGKMLYS